MQKILAYENAFFESTGVKKMPNGHEKMLMARAYSAANLLKNITGISMIAVVNSLSMNATHPDSDIDFLIVTKPKMIWWVRFLSVYILWKNGLWRHKKNITGHICLSFFVTENAMNMEKIAIKDDIYLYFWTAFLRPIIVFDDCYHDFQKANSWVDWNKNFGKNPEKYCIFSGKSRKIRWWHHLGNRFFRFIGQKRTHNSWKKLGKPSGIIICDDMLKFHDKDQREHIKSAVFSGKKWKKTF